MHAAGEIVESNIPINQDVPCEKCGYNLRGLTIPGRCPECGTNLEPSVVAYEIRWREATPIDPGWARQVRAGARLALVALGLMVLPLNLPHEWFRMPFRNAPLARTPGRVAMLSIECVAWTLAWAAAWRLSAVEPGGAGWPRRRGEGVAVARRWLSTAYLLVPFAWAWAAWDTQNASLARSMPGIVLFVAGFLNGFIVLWRIAQILQRGGAWLLALFARLLALAVPITSLIFWSDGFGEGDPSSLGLMLGLPVYPFGRPGILGTALRNILQGRVDWPKYWLVLIPPILAAFVVGWIWILCRPSRLSAPLAK
jgi:hypothetical protein